MMTNEQQVGRKRTSHRVAKVCSSLLVPLMIAVFTIVTTVIQMNIAKQTREQDLRIAEENRKKDWQIEESRREKDFEIANQTRILQNQIEENRHAAEAKAQDEQQMSTVLADYLKDISELMLSKNFTLSDSLISIVVRAKTLTTLGQLDAKRKTHLVRFLYEAKMIGTGGLATIDLRDADLSGVDFSYYNLTDILFSRCNLTNAIFRETILYKINFSNTQLYMVSFVKSSMDYVRFHRANLTNGSFIEAKINFSSFTEVIITNADFTYAKIMNSEFLTVAGNATLFDEVRLENDKFTECIFINASFISSEFYNVDIIDVVLIKANFTNAQLRISSFYRSKLVGSIFNRAIAIGTSFNGADLTATTWINANVKGVDFSQANLSDALISNNQIQRAGKTFNIILPNGSIGYDTNLLKNGDAEGSNGQCEISPWNLTSMVIVKYMWKFRHIFGRCYFTTRTDARQATMSQRVRIPHKYTEWIRAGVANIIIMGECWYQEEFTLHVHQFNAENNSSLVNNTYNSYLHMGQPDLLFPVHIETIEIELKIVFTSNGNLFDESGNCDNLKVAIWYGNYTESL